MVTIVPGSLLVPHLPDAVMQFGVGVLVIVILTATSQPYFVIVGALGLAPSQSTLAEKRFARIITQRVQR